MFRNRMMVRFVALCAVMLLTISAFAQAPVVKKKNFVQRHATITGIAAGAATTHALKASARRKRAMGKKLNFAERHPGLTGVGAAIGTRHIIKKTTPKGAH